MSQHIDEKLVVAIAGATENIDAWAFAETFHDALDALLRVDESVSAIDGGSIKWEIVDATLNSPLTVTMRGIPKVAADYSAPVVKAFLEGIELIDKEGRLPPNFGTQAVSAIQRFARHLENGIGKVTFATPTRRYSPSNRLAKNVAALIAPSIIPAPIVKQDYYEDGEIDGTVENLIGHNQLYFSLYDALNGVRVRCTFQPELSEVVGSHWLKRVVVHGRIRFSPDGQPKEIKVDSLVSQPSRSSLPQFKGHYINITGGVESSAYVRELRTND